MYVRYFINLGHNENRFPMTELSVAPFVARYWHLLVKWGTTFSDILKIRLMFTFYKKGGWVHFLNNFEGAYRQPWHFILLEVPVYMKFLTQKKKREVPRIDPKD